MASLPDCLRAPNELQWSTKREQQWNIHPSLLDNMSEFERTRSELSVEVFLNRLHAVRENRCWQWAHVGCALCFNCSFLIIETNEVYEKNVSWAEVCTCGVDSFSHLIMKRQSHTSEQNFLWPTPSTWDFIIRLKHFSCCPETPCETLIWSHQSVSHAAELDSSTSHRVGRRRSANHNAALHRNCSHPGRIWPVLRIRIDEIRVRKFAL